MPAIFLIKGSSDNANDYKKECRVLCNTSGLSTATNFPPNPIYGLLEVKEWGQGRVTQEYIGVDNFAYHYMRRSENSGTTWSSWTQI